MDNNTRLCGSNPLFHQYHQNLVHKNSPSSAVAVTVLSVILSLLITFANFVVLMSIGRNSFRKRQAHILMFSHTLANLLTGILFLPLAVGYIVSSSLNGSCSYLVLTITVNWLLRVVSYLTVIASCINRYLSLFWEHQHTKYVNKKLTIIIAASIWLFSSIMSPLSAFHCVPKSGWAIALTGGVGLVVLVATNYKIMKLATKHSTNVQEKESTERRKTREKSRKQRVTVTYVIWVALLSYLPIAVTISVIAIRGLTENNTKTFQILDIVFTAGALIDPFVYRWRNRDIRKSVTYTLRNFVETIWSRPTTSRHFDRKVRKLVKDSNGKLRKSDNVSVFPNALKVKIERKSRISTRVEKKKRRSLGREK